MEIGAVLVAVGLVAEAEAEEYEALSNAL